MALILDMSEIVADFETYNVTLIRPTGTYVDSIWTDGTPEEISVALCFQPTKASTDILIEASGDRIAKTADVWSRDLLQIRDRFTLFAQTWEIRAVDNFAENGFYRAVASLESP